MRDLIERVPASPIPVVLAMSDELALGARVALGEAGGDAGVRPVSPGTG